MTFEMKVRKSWKPIKIEDLTKELLIKPVDSAEILKVEENDVILKAVRVDGFGDLKMFFYFKGK